MVVCPACGMVKSMRWNQKACGSCWVEVCVGIHSKALTYREAGYHLSCSVEAVKYNYGRITGKRDRYYQMQFERMNRYSRRNRMPTQSVIRYRKELKPK